MNETALLDVKNLTVFFHTERGTATAVHEVGFRVKKGKTLGIVGESGCGKSVTAMALLRLLPKPWGVIQSGEVKFHQQNLLAISLEELRKIRGNSVAMIFQEPMTALNPVHQVGKQIGEVLRLHNPGISRKEIRKKSIEILVEVGIPSPEKRIHAYPHQLSGGMRQRIMIAIALICSPELLIADEPTTALDVTIQAQILNLLKKLQKENNMAMIFISHDLGVIAEMCDEVAVMYAGKIVEKSPVKELFRSPAHPYTIGLLSSIPRLETAPKSSLKTIEGMVPELWEIPDGCGFQNRCSWVEQKCLTPQELERVTENHLVRCSQWKEFNRNKRNASD